MTNRTFQIIGRIINREMRQGVPQLRVEAWDKDLIFNDLVGAAITDENGSFCITFTEAHYRECFLDRNPDLFFKVYQEGRLVHSTENSACWNISAGETNVVIEVDVAAPVKPIEPPKPPDPPKPKIDYVVKGKVYDQDNNPLPDLQVQAIRRYLRKETLLGSVQTSEQGEYHICYSVSDADEDCVNLVFKVLDREGKLLHQTEVHHNVPKEAEIDIQVPIVFPGFSEFERMTRTLHPLLENGLTFSDLEQDDEHDDISYLSGKTGLEKSKTARFVLSHKLATHCIQPEFWFALLGGSFYQYAENQSLKDQLAVILDSLSSFNAVSVRKALTRGFNLKEISENFREKVADWIDAFLAFAARWSVDGSDKPTFVKLVLEHAGILDAEKQEKFARLLNEHRALTSELLYALEKDQSFKKAEIADLRTSFELSELTQGDFSVVKTIKETFDVRQPEQIRPLAKISEEKWVGLVKEKHAAGEIKLPFEINEPTGQIKLPEAEIYGKTLARDFCEAFPTTAFAGGLERALQNGGAKGLRHAEALSKFLDVHPDFELLNTPVDDYFNNGIHPEFRELTANESFRLEVKATQRVFKLAPSFEASDALLADGLHSAQKIYRMGKSEFVRRYKKQSGFTPKSAQLAWNKAADTHAAALTIVADLKSLEAETLPLALKNDNEDKVTDLKSLETVTLSLTVKNGNEAPSNFPNWKNLFKSGDLCECEHCRSALSPAAYFADLLMFLKDRSSIRQSLNPDGSKPTVKDVLFDRRPDLGFLELNCANALTTLPYIDVVCEVLEDAVDAGAENDLELIGSSAIPPNVATEKAAVAQAFEDAFADQVNKDKEKIKLGSGFSISQISSSDPARWVVHGDDVTYLLKKKSPSADFSAEILRNTKASTAELRAFPQYVNPKAYEKLREAKYPSTLPFDLFAEDVRAAFQKTNFQRWDLMRTLHGTKAPNNATEGEIAAEYFNISSNADDPFDEKRLILEANTTVEGHQEVWGELGNAEWLDVVGNVKNFLQKTGMEYNELLALLDLKFINPDGDIVIQHDDPSCDIDKKFIRVLDAPKLDRIHRFLRLWRKLKDWKMWELDLVIGDTEPERGIGKGALDEAFLIQLFYFSQLKNKLGKKATVERLCTLFDTLNTETHFSKLHEKRESALYQDLFLNRKLIQPLDPAFEIDPANNEIRPIIDPNTNLSKPRNLSEYHSVIFAALGIREGDLVLLKELTKINDDLTLANLSLLWRHAWLAKILKFKISEWKIVLKVFQWDIPSFANPKAAWRFIEDIDHFKATGFKPDEVNWLLAADPSAKVAVKETDASRFLAALRKDLQAIKAEYDPAQYDYLAVKPATDVDNLTQLLTTLLQKLNRSEAEVSFFLAALRGDVLLEVSVVGLPTDFAFPSEITGEPSRIPILYDESNKKFRFSGLMTDDHKWTLLNNDAPALKTLRGSGQLEADVQEGALPGFVFPSAITGAPNNISIKYEELSNLFIFTGLMTGVQQGILLSDALPEDVIGNPVYRDAIEDLYQQSLKVEANYRAAIEELYQQSLDAMSNYLSMEKNIVLPGDFTFPVTITGAPNAIPIRYEQVLRFSGVMTDSERDILLNDPSLEDVTDILAYQQAIERLLKHRGPATVTGLPTGFTFPQTVTGAPNNIAIRYDQVMRFTGLMTAAQQTTLLNDSSLTAVTDIPVYQDTIFEWFERPRLALKFYDPVFTAPLKVLPPSVDFAAQLPADLSAKITYDSEQRLLRFVGMMSAAEQTAIENLSVGCDLRMMSAINDNEQQKIIQEFQSEFESKKKECAVLIVHSISTSNKWTIAGFNDEGLFKNVLINDPSSELSIELKKKPANKSKIVELATSQLGRTLSDDLSYWHAINSLASQPQTSVLSDKRIWLTDNHLDTTLPDNDTFAKRLATAAQKALDYLSIISAENAVIQQSSVQLGLTEAVTRRLLTHYKIKGLPDTLLTHLTDDFTIDSQTLNGWFWAHRIAAIWKKLKITLVELDIIIALTVRAELLDFHEIPLDNTRTRDIPPIDRFLRTSRLLRLRDSLPETKVSLLEVLEKLDENIPATIADLAASDFPADVQRVNDAWLEADVKALITSFNLDDASKYLLVETWERLRRAFYFLDNLNANVDTVKKFAAAAMGDVHAKTIKELLRAKFGTEIWLTLSAEIQDVLRERKRDALAAYLLTQTKPIDVPPSGKWENMNDLYAYYLLDIEMSSCQLTSRLVQGSGSIQLFVQRCFMGLEPDVAVEADGDDSDSAWRWWKWMRKYRVWEANRKVFLWPENWIEPELKKDRSPFFKDLENELLQNEINQLNVEKALTNYLEKLDGVAQLEIAGFYQEDDGDNTIIHVFGRTTGAEPHLYYYRRYDYRQWTPWEKVELDIQGDYLIPAVVNKRLFLFWPVFTEVPDEKGNNQTPYPNQNSSMATLKAKKKLRLQMAVSDYRQGKWTPKRISKEFDESRFSYDVEIVKQHYSFFPADRSLVDGRFGINYQGHSVDSNGDSIDSNGHLIAELTGSFEISGCNGVPEKTLLPGVFEHAIRPDSGSTGEKPVFLKWDEQLRKNSDNDFTFVSDFQHSTLVLQTTPWSFKMSPPWQLSYLDKLSFDGRMVFGDNEISVGNWLPFYYNDKERTFFVLPSLKSKTMRSYYPEIKNTFRNLEKNYEDAIKKGLDTNDYTTLTLAERQKWEQFLHNTFPLDTPPLIDTPPSYTDEQLKNLILRVFMRYVHLYLGQLARGLFQFRQFHFKNYYHPFVCDFAKLIYNPLKGIPALMSRETQLKNTEFNFRQTYQPTLSVVVDNPLTFSFLDIINLPSFASKLKQPQDGVSTYIRSNLSDASIQALANYQGPSSDPFLLQNSLVIDLNRIIKIKELPNDEHFSGVSIRPETRIQYLQWLANPEEDNLIRGNRLLLEDAYPKELSRDRNAYPKEVVDFTPDGAYSSYNWELFFHAPLLIANSLSKNQRFEEAREWYHFMFNPIGVESEGGGSAMSKYWITKPFFKTTDKNYKKQRIANILRMLAKDKTVSSEPLSEFEKQEILELKKQVVDWRTNPFEPHRIANYRTVAYQKTVIMKYLDNLISWGDNLFRQDSMESINEATQLYVLAAEILGPRPKKIPPRAQPFVESFNELEAQFDDFGNALVEVENLVPVLAGNETDGADQAPLPMLYFCIPQNDKMLGYWDAVADRLYKIRHCMNIEGAVRQLALFEPPIDPGALVKAVAGGVDISSALADLNAPLPLYRFNVLLQKANEVCNDVKALGGALLAALEKKDAEALGLLRQGQEISLLEAVETVRKKQIDEAKENLEGMKKSKELAQFKKEYYASREFLNVWELVAMALNSSSTALDIPVSMGYTSAGVLGLIPDFLMGASGFGGSPHATVEQGGNKFSNAAKLAMEGLAQIAKNLDKMASLSSTLASYNRRQDEWDFQKGLPVKEIEQIKIQIVSAELRVDIAKKELENHVLQIKNAKAADDFMRSKYTNEELYQWQVGQISGVYFQSYKLAYDLAKRAERCFRFELGLQDSSYISFGYWDSLKKGLLSGEKLQHDLRRLETAYLEQNRREFELTKHISLVLLDPLALMKLRETGRCFINLPEEIFDLDYPGHYFRRIKSVSLSLPCVTGPYTTVSCTLRLLKNSIRINTANGDNGYPRNTDDQELPVDDDRFIENNIPVKAVAASSAQNDSGVFELSFRDERYLPFEGAGTVSDWSLELFSDLPPNNPDPRNPDFGNPLRQFDYNTISDAILHIKYTSREDAGPFKNGSITHLRDYFSQDGESNSLRMLNLKQEFPTQWHQFLHPLDPTTGNIFELEMKPSLFPLLGQGGGTLKVNTIWLLARCANEGSYNVVMSPPLPLSDESDISSNTLTLASANQYGGLHFSQKEVSVEVMSTAQPVKWQLKMTRSGGGDLQEDPVTKAMEVDDFILVLGYGYEWE